ncbi:MAG: phosphatidylserine/phosphatidylglycerophosphate/cardiolipin synthase family protein, partial [Pseudomonadota bacterium]
MDLGTLTWAQTAVFWLLPALLLMVIASLLLVIWSIKRHRDPHLRIACDAPIGELIPTLAGLTHAAAIDGNAVEIYEERAFFDALFDGIQSATRSLHFETFLWKKGKLGERTAQALAQRALAGVTVRVLIDATGGKEMAESEKRTLIESGCKLQMYHERRPRNIGVMNQRDHRKLVVIDGRTAFVCGHCIVDSWCEDVDETTCFRDIGVRLRGPVVHAVQSTFSENWVEETGELFVGDAVFPKLDAAGEVTVHVARLKPEGSAPAVKILHHLAICAARERITIQNPYFLPDPEAIEALAQAVTRGVEVRVMVPSAQASDMPIVQHAAHRNFHKLLDSGVRIFEYSKTLLHQKVMTIDGIWSAIGSSNFDDRSFEIN